MATLVFTVLGPDQPGLVDRLAGLVSAHEGNWERSQMARLGGRFAGIVEVSLPDDRADDLAAALGALGQRGPLVVTVDQAGVPATEEGRRITLSLVGTDRPGLVHAVSAALAEVGANIEELATATTNAPMTGGPLFEATATVLLPPSVDAEAVRAGLEALADRLMVDIDLDG